MYLASNIKQLDGVWDVMCVCVCVFVSGKVWGSSFGEADGMLGSILGGSHAYKSFDVVLLQHRGNMHKRWKASENEEKKWMTKGESGLIWGKKGVSSLFLPEWLWLAGVFDCAEKHISFFHCRFPSQNAFLNRQIKAGTSESFCGTDEWTMK